MSAVLNTNTASLWAAKNLLGAQNRLAASVERLSSGLRINRARDDAAGLGVANSLTAQINGAMQGMRNLNDAISMVQTAEGAIAAASDMGQRILMLATQGANGTLGVTERRAIQREMLELLSSIDSIGARTEFSGNPLLHIQRSEAVDTTAYSMQISNEADDTIALKNPAFYDIGYTFRAEKRQFTVAPVTVAAGKTGSVTLTIGTGDDAETRTVTLAAGATYTAANIRSALIDGSSTVTGISVEDSDGFVVGSLAADGAADIVVTSADSKDYAAGEIKIASDTDVADLAAGDALLASVAGGTVEGLDPADYGQASELYSAVSVLAAALSRSEANGETDAERNFVTNAFKEVQTAANDYVVNLGTQRSLLGAYQNQMEFTLANITELSSNLSSARSRVIDTDYASETAALTRGQILQQAATAMLAQANQMPNVILTLLK